MFRPHPDLWNATDVDDADLQDEPQINKLTDHEPEFTSRQQADMRARRRRKRTNAAAGKLVRRNRARRGG